LDHLLAYPVEVSAQLDQHLGRDTLTLPDQPQQDVLRTDVVVPQLKRLPQTQLQHLLGPRREGNMTTRSLLPLADDLLHLLAHTLQGDPQALQSLGGHALTLMNEAEQDVLGADVVVVEHPGLLLGQNDNSPRSVGEPLEHPCRSSRAPQPWLALRHRVISVSSLYRRAPTERSRCRRTDGAVLTRQAPGYHRDTHCRQDV